MTEDRDERMDELQKAMELFLQQSETGDSSQVDEAIRSDPRLRELLEPMLAEGAAEAAGSDAAFAADAPPDAKGSFGDFRLLRELGRGGMGVVHEAVQVSLNRRVALKLLPPERVQDPSAVLRFKREAAATAALNHAGIVKVFATGSTGATLFLAMELLEGPLLLAHLAGLPPEQRAPAAAALLATVAEALHHAHQAGIVHRDVKPGNVMLRKDGTPVLTDFGIASQEQLPSLTATGDFAGTPYYVAPEVVRRGASAADARSDVWSLGATLYEAICGRRPFEGETSLDVMHRILTRDPEDPRRHAPDLAPDLAAIALKALEKDPAQRYATAGEMAEDLRAFLAYRPVRAKPATITQRVRRFARREPWKAGLAALLAVGLPTVLALGGYLVAKAPEIRAFEALQLHEQVEQVLAEGFLEYSEGRRDTSIPIFARALALAPDSVEALAGHVLAHQKNGNSARALQLLRGRPDMLARNHELRRLEARLLRDLRRDDEAKAVEAELGELRGPLDHFLAGLAATQEGHVRGKPAFERAVRLLETAILSSERARAIYHLEYAHAVGHLEDRARARAVEASLALRFPNSPQAWFWISFCHGFQDPRRAAAAAEKALELRPDWLVALGNAAKYYHTLKDWKSARIKYEAALRLAPDDADLLEDYGNTLHELGEPDAAEAAYHRALALDPRMNPAWVGLGQIAQERRDWPKMLEWMTKGAESDPQDFSAWFGVGFALRSQGRLQEARAAYEKAVATSPGTVPQPRVNLANVLLDLNEPQRALDLLREALKIDPKLPQAYSAMANALARTATEDERLSFAAEWRARLPNDFRAHRESARILVSRKGAIDAEVLDQAEPWVQRALELTNGRDPDSHALLAYLLHKRGQQDAAVERMVLALRLGREQRLSQTTLQRWEGDLAVMRAAAAEDAATRPAPAPASRPATRPG
ncbi:MAG: protein kinase [Planctomycetes bacterium]|nr:protein kinase [Planctomycetota bacterium]